MILSLPNGGGVLPPPGNKASCHSVVAQSDGSGAMFVTVRAKRSLKSRQ